MTCEDCIYRQMCWLITTGKSARTSIACKNYVGKHEYIKLPYKPIPLTVVGNEFDSDVYCPNCGTDLSGYYGDKPLSVIQCFKCGLICDNTRTVSLKEAKRLLKFMKQNTRRKCK